MPVFKYTAVNIEGKTLNGSIEAENSKVVREILKRKGYIPKSLQEDKGKITLEDIFASKIELKDLAFFCSDLNYSLSAGITVMRVLEICRDNAENKRLKKAINRAYEEVKRGKSISEAFKRTNSFPDMFNYMVEVGEASGKLDEVMLNLGEYYHNQYKIKKKIDAAIMYPKILSIMTIVVTIFLITNIVPKFMTTLNSIEGQVPIPTQVVLALNNVIRNYYWILIIVGIGAFAFCKLYIFKNEKFLALRDRLLIKNKFTKPITERIVTARFSRTFAILFSSGIGIIECIEITANAVDNRYVRDGLLKAKELINRGHTISEALEKVDVFPIMLLQSIKIGEETGKMDEILKKSSSYYDGEADFAIKKITTLLEPIMIVVLAVIVGFVMLAIILPMFNIYENMGG